MTKNAPKINWIILFVQWSNPPEGWCCKSNSRDSGSLQLKLSRLCCRQKHEKGFTVCGLAWHPSGTQIAYTDTEGCLGLLDGLSTSNTTKAPEQTPAKDYDDLFDDDDDRLMDEGLSDTNSPVKKPVAEDDDDDDDFLVPATGRVRNREAILDDENSRGEWKKEGNVWLQMGDE